MNHSHCLLNTRKFFCANTAKINVPLYSNLIWYMLKDFSQQELSQIVKKKKKKEVTNGKIGPVDLSKYENG